MSVDRKLQILGTRGIPAGHGGFETFAQRLALYLVERGWEVTVYCQTSEQNVSSKMWKGVRLIYITTPRNNSLGSILFDFRSTVRAATTKGGIILTLGYNTAIFSILYRLCGKFNIINMDGLEWQRQKWNALEKAWLYLNERIGAKLGNWLVADHPEMKKYLCRSVPADKIVMIPYGAERISQSNVSLLESYGLAPQTYALVVARPEPENSIWEIVSAFSAKKRGYQLVVLGNYHPENAYHHKVLQAASEEVLFLGAIYDPATVHTLRVHTRLYIHGHTVGGTNPSLVEALAASSPVLAQDNAFNRWVAGETAHYFSYEAKCMQKLNELLDDSAELEKMRKGSRKRYEQAFASNKDLRAYEEMFLSHLANSPKVALLYPEWEV
ncbi:MAG: DUF1972 domain-containing protein [Cyanophyceae cyanobacterium]